MSFPGDRRGIRCCSGRKSGDIFNDYLDIKRYVRYDASKVTWALDNFATSEEYRRWEKQMQLGFDRCYTYDKGFDDYSCVELAHRCVDAVIVSWWHEEIKCGVRDT